MRTDISIHTEKCPVPTMPKTGQVYKLRNRKTGAIKSQKQGRHLSNFAFTLFPFRTMKECISVIFKPPSNLLQWPPNTNNQNCKWKTNKTNKIQSWRNVSVVKEVLVTLIENPSSIPAHIKQLILPEIPDPGDPTSSSDLHTLTLICTYIHRHRYTLVWHLCTNADTYKNKS